MDPLSTAGLDYLQRSGLSPLPLPMDSPAAASPRVVRVSGVGVLDKAIVPGAGEAALGLTAGMLTGLYGHKVPLAFQLHGGASGIGLHMGTWTSSDSFAEATARLQRRFDTLTSLLQAAHPAITLGPADGQVPPLPSAGLALGVPTVHPPDPRDGSLAMDRLIRAMAGGEWAALVLADPVSDGYASEVRASLINEMRVVQAASLSSRAPSPLAEHHTKLLQATLDALTQGQAMGTWRVAVYLSGDRASYHRLAGVWRGTFSGPESLPEPIRVWAADEVATLAAGWAMPYAPGPSGAGPYRHPFLYQTLLTSAQLAAYVHLPQLETTGFSVTIVPDFDIVRRPVGQDRSLMVGTVVERARPTTVPYRVDHGDLTRHTFVAGVTGSGKTNTILHLLGQLPAEVPFLVIEPAKTEYRALLRHPELATQVRVFTAGDERVSPLRLNPFEVPAGTSVAQHLDLLRAVFAAAFGMWTPLPQVLERCLHEVYTDHGWDLTSGENRRLEPGDDPTPSFPNLGDLVAKVGEVVPRLGYEERIAADIEAALITRLDALRRGGKGRMLDVRRSMPMEELLGHPAVLELEPMGDDDDKAFLMALLLVRLVEHRRAQGRAAGLRHVLVVEEAHRLLSAVPRQATEEQGDPRGKAVESFAQLLAEIRAYGQGVVVADQVPVRLAPDVIKNTGLKIAHRTVAADDRQTLAGAMAMNARQAVALTTLGPGQAAVFGDGDDVPILVQVPRGSSADPPSGPEVQVHTTGWRQQARLEDVFDVSPFCRQTCADSRTCDSARHLAEDGAVRAVFDRTVLSTLEEAGGLDRLWEDLAGVVRARRPADVPERQLLRSLAGHLSERLAGHRGAQSAWSYRNTDEFAAKLRAALLERLDEKGATQAREAFRAYARALYERTFEPYPACSVICDQANPPLCLYRPWMADLVASRRYHDRWTQADQASAQQPDRNRDETWQACQDAGYAAIEFPEGDWPPGELREAVTAGARRACMCYAQQMLAADERLVPRSGRRILKRIIQAAGL